MSFFDRIVVGVEYSDEKSPQDAAKAIHIQQAFQLAAASRCPITLVSVVPEARPGWFESAEDAEKRAVTEEADATAWLQVIKEQCGGDAEGVVVRGTPWLEIMRVANGDPRSLLVCATRQRTAFTRVLFGSTGMKLLRYSPGPVWLVHPNPDGDDRLDILAASDLTSVGQNVIEVAVSLAKLLPSRLHAITVAETETERLMSRRGVDESARERMYAKARAACEQKLQEQVSQTDYRTLESGVQTHAMTGDADAGILQAIDNLNTNLVVMATRARGGVAGMMLGNTAERLLTALPCSALVIKPDDFRSPVELS